MSFVALAEHYCTCVSTIVCLLLQQRSGLFGARLTRRWLFSLRQAWGFQFLDAFGRVYHGSR